MLDRIIFIGQLIESSNEVGKGDEPESLDRLNPFRKSTFLKGVIAEATWEVMPRVKALVRPKL